MMDDNFRARIRDEKIWEVKQSVLCAMRKILKRKRLSDQSVLVTVPKPTSPEDKQALITITTEKLSIKSETDRINELPDEILFCIASHFTVRHAANASVLSSRWRYLCASMSSLKFDINTLFRPDPDSSRLLQFDTGNCREYKDKFVRGVNQFLQYYKGSRLLLFGVTFCLEQDSAYDVDQWVSFALSMGVKDLYLNLSCDYCYVFDKTCQSRLRNLYTLQSKLLSQGNMAKVQNLYLRSCILGPGVVNLFSGLLSLHMSHAILGADEVQTMLSCCLNLESMILGRCTLIPILCIPGSLHRLKFLAVIKCSGVEEIKLSAKNLARFDYDGRSLIFSFSGAPNLKQVFFRGHDERKMQYVFCQLAKDLPLVETLSIYSNANWVHCLPEQITTFSKVKQLEFYSPWKIKFNLLKIIAILKACPLLKKFHMVVSVDIEEGNPMPISSLDGVHKYLKEVYIGGFKFIGGYIELALCLLNYGVALERMVIDPKIEFYFGSGYWFACGRKTWDEGEQANVCLQLKDHTKSSVIIIK